MVTKSYVGEGCTRTVEFKALGVKSNAAPIIIEQFTDDNGEVIFILANGNTQSELSYNRFWGRPKGIVLPKGTKGDNPDKTKII